MSEQTNCPDYSNAHPGTGPDHANCLQCAHAVWQIDEPGNMTVTGCEKGRTPCIG